MFTLYLYEPWQLPSRHWVCHLIKFLCGPMYDDTWPCAKDAVVDKQKKRIRIHSVVVKRHIQTPLLNELSRWDSLDTCWIWNRSPTMLLLVFTAKGTLDEYNRISIVSLQSFSIRRKVRIHYFIFKQCHASNRTWYGMSLLTSAYTLTKDHSDPRALSQLFIDHTDNKMETTHITHRKFVRNTK